MRPKSSYQPPQSTPLQEVGCSSPRLGQRQQMPTPSEEHYSTDTQLGVPDNVVVAPLGQLTEEPSNHFFTTNAQQEQQQSKPSQKEQRPREKQKQQKENKKQQQQPRQHVHSLQPTPVQQPIDPFQQRDDDDVAYTSLYSASQQQLPHHQDNTADLSFLAPRINNNMKPLAPPPEKDHLVDDSHLEQNAVDHHNVTHNAQNVDDTTTQPPPNTDSPPKKSKKDKRESKRDNKSSKKSKKSSKRQ